MKKIVILGNSVAGVKVSECMRETSDDLEICIFLFDEMFPYRRDYFSDVISKNMKENAAQYKNEEYYRQQRINLILDKKISRINFKKKKIFTEDKIQIDYDTLIITDSIKNTLPKIKGTNKTGIFGFSKITDIKGILNALPFSDIVIFQTSTLEGLQQASSFVKREKDAKEVIVVCPSKNIFSPSLSSEESSFLCGLLEERGLRIIENNEVSEILGDSFVKAVRLSSKKVIACQLVIFNELENDLKLLRDLSTTYDNNISVNGEFKTSIDDVYAMDSVCEGAYSFSVNRNNITFLEDQGRVVAERINGGEPFPQSPSLVQAFQLKDIFITFIGDISHQEGVMTQVDFDEDLKTLRKLFISNQCLIGAILINQEEEKGRLVEIIGGEGR